MKAIVCTRYGPPEVLELREVPRPEPQGNQVLVKVRAASANALDYRRFETVSAFGRVLDAALFKSTGKVLGADISGMIECVGSSVMQLQPGDEVFGVAAGSAGGFAEYALADEDDLVRKPGNVSFEAAAAVPVAALTALQALRDKGEIKAGQKVLIYGGSGGVGTFAVQIAKAFGTEVTAVCSTRNVDMVRSIGAEHVIDYIKESFNPNGQRFDLIAGVNGYQSILSYRRALNPGGTYVAAGGSMVQIFQGMLLGSLVSKLGSQKMLFMGIASINQKDLAFMAELLEAGKVRPVVEKCYPLAETAQAIRYLVDEHARGKVVITM